jgi:ribosome-associated heat shock protein Hsp15
MRLDKWLWAARLYKTRSLAAVSVDLGRVRVNGQSVKPARELRPGDQVSLRHGAGASRTVVVLGLAAIRGPAPVAQALYCETTESLAARVRAAEQASLGPEPAKALTGGRPTKRERRELDRASDRWQRWSASIDKR